MDYPAPNIQKILLKICKRYERRLELSGMMKLGQELSDDELHVIENFFGLHPLTRTAKDEVKLSFDRLLADKGDDGRKLWIKEIYHLLGRDMPETFVGQEDDSHLIFEQLRLAYPRLGAVHEFLRLKGASAFRLSGTAEDRREFLFTAGRIVDFLLDNEEPLTLPDLGARFCGNSKVLRQGGLKNLLEQWLRLMRPDLPEDADIWQEFMVLRDCLTVNALVYGPLIYQKGGRQYDWIHQLYLAGEPAWVSWSHLDGVNSIELAPEAGHGKTLITCENEAPFSNLLRERPDKIIIYTAGFPNRAVRKIYQLLGAECACRHWGDSDLAGLRIAAILHAIHPLTLWRCDLATVKSHISELRPLAKSQVRIAASLLVEAADFPFRKELGFTLKYGWLEQESWFPALKS